MTNHWVDIKNAKLVLICGGNPAENHPGGFQWALNARQNNGAKIVVIDPRRTRVATMADNFMRIRPGTNAAFMMGLINYAINKGRVDKTYISEKINRPFLADDGTAATLDATSTYGGWPKWTDASFKLNAARNDYERAPVTVGTKTISNMPVVLSDWETNPDSVYTALKNEAAHYTSARVATICRIPGGAAEFEAIANVITDPANRPGTILYAMGGTQHAHAASDLRAYCLLQLVLGNMGKAGGGVNALRGIHNVQGSTDMGLLYASMPGYSGTPTTGQLYSTYMNGLFGNKKAAAAPYWGGLQQAGFRNMMHWYFRQTSTPITAEYTADDNRNFDLLPKGGDYIHMEMFKNMHRDTPDGQKVKCLFVFGQNPAVTEPNLGVVRGGEANPSGLYELDTLVCMDVFENETAGCDRKATGVTYLLPSAAFTEEAGSVTNSGRVLQWREQATPPKGGTKCDLEILLRLAQKLEAAGAFSHIPMPVDASGTAFSSKYAGLYGSQYGWTPTAGVDDFDCTTVAENVYKQLGCHQGAPSNQTITVNGKTYTDDLGWGAMWIYVDSWSLNTGTAPHNVARLGAGMTAADWATNGGVPIRAASRNPKDPSGKGLTPCWGYAWLVNRRVFYNNKTLVDALGNNYDVDDNFVAPDKVARIWCHDATHNPPIADYSNTYRAYSKITGGSIPKHHEPVESPDLTLKAQYPPINSPKHVPQNVGSPAEYKLVLTTIRVTEHFQGGVLTRNLPWLSELVPEPFIEINAQDAIKYGNIKTGNKVMIDTARGSSGPYKAVVGSGSLTTQRVMPGYVAIPWHWGNKGISQGASANDITMDALDPDSYIPEYKACLCNIRKVL